MKVPGSPLAKLSYSLYLLTGAWFCVSCATTTTTTTPIVNDPLGFRSNASAEARANPRQPEQESASSVDPKRASLPLARIPPPLSPPVRPDSIAPLSERAAQQVTAAEELVNEQRYTEAALALERALRYEPNHSDIHRTLATLHWQAGNIERAKSHAQRALLTDPSSAQAYYVLARCEATSGNRTEAITALRTALLCPDIQRDAETAALCHFHLAELLAADGYSEAALGQYSAFETKAGELNRKAARPELSAVLDKTRGSAGPAKSEILEKLGRHAEAAAVLAPLTEAEPENVALSTRFARLSLKARKFDSALRAARAIQADDPETLELLRDIHEAMGHPERIVEDLRERLATRSDNPRLVLALADFLKRKGKHKEAIAELKAYLARQPDNETIRGDLVELLVEQGGLMDAVKTCAEGLTRGPQTGSPCESKIRALADRKVEVRQLLDAASRQNSAAVLYLLGRLAQDAQLLEQAESILRRSHELDNGFLPTRFALGRLYLQSYRYDEALRAVARTEPEKPEHESLEIILGEVYDRLDDRKLAEQHFRAAIQLNRSDSKAMFLLAKLYERWRDISLAQRQIRAILDSNPSHDLARETLAFTYLQEGKSDVAIHELEDLKRRTTDPFIKARCTAILEQVQNSTTDSFRKTLLEALDRHGPDAATWAAIAESYRRFDELPDRREAFLRALAIDPDHEEALFGAATVDTRLLDFESAVTRLEKLLRRRPNRHVWCLEQIELHMILQDYAEALALAKKGETATNLDDAIRRDYRLRILDALRYLQQPEAVSEQLASWVESEPDNQLWSLALAADHQAHGQTEGAVAILQRLYDSKPGDPRLSRELIDSLGAAGRHDQAFQFALEAIEDDPRNDESLFFLLQALTDAGRLDDAMELMRNRLLHTLKRVPFQDAVIRVHRLSGRYREGREYIESLLDELSAVARGISTAQRPQTDRPRVEQLVLRPDEPFTPPNLEQRFAILRQRLIEQMILARDFREAEQQLLTWLETAKDPELRFEHIIMLARCYQAQHEEARAAEQLEAALTLKPDQVGLNNDVAYTRIDQGIRLDEAERQIRFALSRKPREAAYLDTFGWLQYKLGKFTEAKLWLERSARARTVDDPVILDHLADTYWRLGKSDEAILYWRDAIAAARLQSQDNLSGDERRVQQTTPKKLEDALTGRQPGVAAVVATP